jgi:hypothetical protein
MYKVGGTDKELFLFLALSVDFWGWMGEVEWRVSGPRPSSQPRCPTLVGTNSWRRGPVSHGRGVDGFVEVGVRGGHIVE